MSEDVYFFNKDPLVIKTPKKSPLLPRLVVFAFVMVCGVYICSICLQQVSKHTTARFLNIKAFTTTRFLNIKALDQPCDTSNIEQWEIPYVHYPKPKTFSRDECACNPVRYFAIFSMQRSGSGWFETLLNSHINVSSNGEIFGARERRASVSAIVQTLERVYNLDWLSSASKNECNAAVGFKWMLNQGVIEHHEGIVEYFKKKGVHAIFLFRRNLLRRMISVLSNSYDKRNKPLNGAHKSHVHSSAEATILAKYKPIINATTLITELKHVDDRATRAIKYFKSTRHIVVYYEDVVGNLTNFRAKKLKEVQDFLRLPCRAVR